MSAFVRERSDAGEPVLSTVAERYPPIEPMRDVVARGFNESGAQLIGRQALLHNPVKSLGANSRNIVLDDGRYILLPFYMIGYHIGGLATKLEIDESITVGQLRIKYVDQLYLSLTLNELNENGIISIEFVRNRTNTFFRIVDDVTTFNDKSDPVKAEMSFGPVDHFLVPALKGQLEDQNISTRTINSRSSMLDDFIQSYFYREKQDHEIVRLTAEGVQVTFEANVERISKAVNPMSAVKKISVDLVYKQNNLEE
ncbi:tail sheath protein [Staphylococcus phage vB_SauH_DELF3]|nr:tail sheath protein [Staphylococcus phage vB_SauH_DELF3]